MKTARQRVLEFIRTRRVVRVAELSHALKMTPANARHHLAILQEQGLVRLIGEEQAAGKGRPANIYSLTEFVDRHNLDRLTGSMLDELLSGSSHQEQEQLLLSLAQRVLGTRGSDEPKPGTTPARSFTQAIYQTVQRLNEMKYQARWEARADAPHLILGHCPYAAIIADHPELCQMDAQMLEIMLQRPVTQTGKLLSAPQGDYYCRFILRRDQVIKPGVAPAMDTPQ